MIYLRKDLPCNLFTVTGLPDMAVNIILMGWR